MIIAFSGHSVINYGNKVKEIVKEQIKKHIIDKKNITCYLGGYGDFDRICTFACRELIEEHIEIRLVYITPYIKASEQIKIKEMINCGMYDESIYPPIENVPLKFAISKRNEWMMKNADLVIAYVNYNYGGAYKSLQIAKRCKKKIINICDLI